MTRDRFFGSVLGAILGLILGSLFGELALVSAVTGFLAVFVWQLQNETRLRTDTLKRELDLLRRQIAGVTSPPSLLQGTEAATKPSELRPAAKMPAERPDLPAEVPPPISAHLHLPKEPVPSLEPVPHPTVEPNAFVKALTTAIGFFTTGNVIAKVGVVMLFLGVSFLVKYVGDRGWFPIEARLSLAASGAFVMTAFGWRLRANRAFGLVLQGGGIGVFYLVVFAAFRMYDLIPSELAFGLLFATTAFAVTLAILQDASTLAIFGASGGFLAPILTSTGGGSHVTLFSYYALLNLGILAIAWFRSWRLLNVTGFLFTFVIGGVWGAKYYKPEYFNSVEPFLIGFLALYIGIVYLFSRRDDGVNGVDAGLLFGAPVVAFAMQAGLVADTKFGLAISAVALGGFYTIVAWRIFRASGKNPFLLQAYVGLGLAFLTLAVPLAFDGKWTAAVWAPEGAAVLWAGLRQRRKLVQLTGGALLLAAGLAFGSAADRAADLTPILNAFFVGYAVLAAAYFAAGLSLQRDDENRWRPVPAVLAVLSGAWWLTGGIRELDSIAPALWSRVIGETLESAAGHTVSAHAAILFATLTTVGYTTLGRRLNWRWVEDFRRGLLPLLSLFVLFIYGPIARHPGADIGGIAWIVALGVHYFLLNRAMKRGDAAFEFDQHFLPIYLVVLLSSWELWWQVMRAVASPAWALAAATFPFVAVTFGLTAYRTEMWPLGLFRTPYLGKGLLPVVGAGFLFVLFLGFQSGNPIPIPYVPILNPIDVASLAMLMAGVLWWFRVLGEKALPTLRTRDFVSIAGSVAFVWLTTAVVRAMHMFTEVRWNASNLIDSTVVQAALSVTWSLVALVLMVFATRQSRRLVWLIGSALLGVVAAKLLIFDLAAQDTLARVVSFLATGVLWLVVGYFAPLPPRIADQPEQEVHG